MYTALDSMGNDSSQRVVAMAISRCAGLARIGSLLLARLLRSDRVEKSTDTSILMSPKYTDVTKVKKRFNIAQIIFQAL